MSWVSGIRNPGTQGNVDKTNAVVGPSKSASEELVSRDFPSLALAGSLSNIDLIGRMRKNNRAALAART